MLTLSIGIHYCNPDMVGEYVPFLMTALIISQGSEAKKKQWYDLSPTLATGGTICRLPHMLRNVQTLME